MHAHGWPNTYVMRSVSTRASLHSPLFRGMFRLAGFHRQNQPAPTPDKAGASDLREMETYLNDQVLKMGLNEGRVHVQNAHAPICPHTRATIGAHKSMHADMCRGKCAGLHTRVHTRTIVMCEVEMGCSVSAHVE